LTVFPRTLGKLALGAACLLATPAPAQHAPHTAPSANDFSLQPWVSLSQGPSLIRDPITQTDITTHDSDDTYVTVYARKKHEREGPGLGRRVDGDEAGYSDAATPWDLPAAPPTHCGNSAYQNIGGQPGTGADMMGALARPC
jgi:hypothetical protein